MSEILWPVGLILGGALGLLYPILMNRFLESHSLQSKSSEIFLSVLARFERRNQISTVLVIVGVLWILSESL